MGNETFYGDDLTSNQMILLVQFGINKHSKIFQRLQIVLALRGRGIFCGL